MCRVEKKDYVGDDGRLHSYEDSFLCTKSRNGQLCKDVKRRTVAYPSRAAIVSRDDKSSPASSNPPTPTGSGTYLVQQRRPSGIIRRPSTKDGKTRILKPEIVIEFGSKKDKSKKYTASSTRSYKRSSLGAASINSNDVAVESPGSDASYTLRTGFPEAPIPPTDPPGYTTRPAVPRGHRHTSSSSSFTTSASQPPSLYATSEPGSPSSRRAPRYPPTIVHNPPVYQSELPSIPQAPAPAPAPSSPSYRTVTTAPRASASQDSNIGADGIFPTNYSEFHSYTTTTYNNTGRSAAPEITDRDADRARQRQARAEADKRRQEQADLEMARKIAMEEEQKQVRFELGRAEGRAHERAETTYAHRELRRAEDREDSRRQRQEENDRAAAEAHRFEEQKRREQEKKDQAAWEAKKEADRLRADLARRDEIARKERELQELEAQAQERGRKHRSGPPTRDFTKTSRRRSISRHDIIERERLLAETSAQMAREREAADRREREEQTATLIQQQQQQQYWDPRGGSRVPESNPGMMGRRNSVSGRRPSISGPPPTLPIGNGMERRNSQRRVSIIQPAPPSNMPPPTNTSIQTTSTAMFSPSSSGTYSTRPQPSYHNQPNPFALLPTHVSATIQDNPFLTSVNYHHPWHPQDLREALPQAPTLRRHGTNRARQATQNMQNVVGYDNEYVVEEPKHGRKRRT